MENIIYRQLLASEQPAMSALTNYAFAVNTPVPDQSPTLLAPQWTLGAFDGDKLAACSGAFPFMARVNGNRMQAQGITAVATNPGYRRLGLVREQICRWLAAAHDEGVALSMLWASMAAIYQRFGYGLGTVDVSYQIDTSELQFDAPANPASGQVTLEDPQDLRTELDALHRRFIAPRNLMLKRHPPMWDRLLRTKPTYCALFRNSAGEIDGSVLYRTEWDGPMGPKARQIVQIVDLLWCSQDAWLALWHYLKAHDLAGRIVWGHAPQDDPLPHRILEPRCLNRRTDDGLWLRIVDTKAALTQRGYSQAGRATLELAPDPLCPWNDGTWQIDATTSGAEVSAARPGTAADARLDANALAMLVAGSSRASDLAHSGRLVAHDHTALSRLDALFATRYRPWCPDHF